FDVIELNASTKPDIVRAGFLEDLDYGNIPNAAGLFDELRDVSTVSIWNTQEGLVYNTEGYKELGLDPPTSYADLANPALKGRVGVPDSNHGQAPSALVGFAVEAGSAESDIGPGLEALRKLDISSYYKSSVDLSAQFQTGDVYAAIWHVGWA